MKHVFWVLPAQLCGRSGPNLDPWVPTELKEGGIGAILSVNSGDLVHAGDLAALDIAYQCTPLSADAPPREGDLELCVERLPFAYKFVAAQIEGGRAVLVHCRQGRDRTGMFMAYFLKKSLGLSTEESIRRVKAVRPIALGAQGWDGFVPEVLEACK